MSNDKTCSGKFYFIYYLVFKFDSNFKLLLHL